MLTIKTNNVPREVLEAYELTPTQREHFDYINWHAVAVGDQSQTFFRYKGELYDTNDCERSTIPHWDGMYTQTFFSGVLFRWVEDSEFTEVVVGRYYC